MPRATCCCHSRPSCIQAASVALPLQPYAQRLPPGLPALTSQPSPRPMQCAHAVRDAAQRHERGALQLLARQPRVPRGAQLLLAGHELVLRRQRWRRRQAALAAGSGSGSGRHQGCCFPLLCSFSRPTCLLAPRCAALQETLANLRQAMRETKIMCAVMLDTKVCTLWSSCCGLMLHAGCAHNGVPCLTCCRSCEAQAVRPQGSMSCLHKHPCTAAPASNPTS